MSERVEISIFVESFGFKCGDVSLELRDVQRDMKIDASFLKGRIIESLEMDEDGAIVLELEEMK